MIDENADQLDRQDLAGMTLEEINAAREAGRLRALVENPEFTRERPTRLDESLAKAETRLEAMQQFEKFRNDPVGFIRDILNGSDPRQLTQEDLAKMSYAEINKARREGRLNALMGIE